MAIYLDFRRQRQIFIFLNVIFWAFGWGALVAGIWLYMQKNIYSILAPSSYSSMSAAGLCAAVGAMVLIISLVGIAGIWFNSSKLIISYFCFVLLLFIIQCIAGLMGILYKESVYEYAKLNLRHTINLTYGDNPNAVLLWNAWAQMQNDLNCCGAISHSDWFYYPGWKGRKFVPDSCCNLKAFNLDLFNHTQNCGKSLENFDKIIYKQGCVGPFTDWLLQHLHITKLLTLLLGILEILILFSTMHLFLYLRKNKKFNQCNRHSIADELETNSLTTNDYQKTHSQNRRY
uniref:Tetraspanin n=1 Tax=Meloidogyne incognita TaxID=6306 RepID=A0A914LSX8_MELIC